MDLVNHTSFFTNLKTCKTIFLVSKYLFAIIWKELEWQNNYGVQVCSLVTSLFVVQCYRKNQIMLLFFIAYDVMFRKSIKSLTPRGSHSK